jgi:hypothetical protein
MKTTEARYLTVELVVEFVFETYGDGIVNGWLGRL